MWSDSARSGKILGLGAVLLILGLYHAYVAMTVVFGYRDCMEDPARWNGTALVFPLWEVTRIDDPEHYAISKVLKDVPVEGDSSPLHIGSTVSLVGEFRQDGVVLEKEREIHILRDWKERLGILGFVLAIGAAPFFFRVQNQRVSELIDG